MESTLYPTVEYWLPVTIFLSAENVDDQQGEKPHLPCENIFLKIHIMYQKYFMIYKTTLSKYM